MDHPLTDHFQFSPREEEEGGGGTAGVLVPSARKREAGHADKPSIAFCIASRPLDETAKEEGSEGPPPGRYSCGWLNKSKKLSDTPVMFPRYRRKLLPLFWEIAQGNKCPN